MFYFSKLKKLHTSNFITTKIKGQTIISSKQNLDNEAFKVDFVLLETKIIENFKLKIKLLNLKTKL